MCWYANIAHDCDPVPSSVGCDDGTHGPGCSYTDCVTSDDCCDGMGCVEYGCEAPPRPY